VYIRQKHSNLFDIEKVLKRKEKVLLSIIYNMNTCVSAQYLFEINSIVKLIPLMDRVEQVKKI